MSLKKLESYGEIWGEKDTFLNEDCFQFPYTIVDSKDKGNKQKETKLWPRFKLEVLGSNSGFNTDLL